MFDFFFFFTNLLVYTGSLIGDGLTLEMSGSQEPTVKYLKNFKASLKLYIVER